MLAARASVVSECGVSRLSKALLAALALHGSLLLIHARHARPQAAKAPAAEELVVVEEAVEAPPEPEAEAAIANGAASTAPRANAKAASRATLGAPSGEGAAPEAVIGSDIAAGPAVAAAAGDGNGAQASAQEPPRKINFGIDNGFFMRPSTEPMPRVKKPVYLQQMQDALSADDVRRGLARGNALLGSLSSAAREVGPVRGDALLSVTVGADGSVSAAELLRGDASEWASVIASFRSLAASKHVRVPPGARGVRVTFAILAKVQRPSGKEIDASGTDIEPNGSVRHSFDVSDLGSSTQRLVYAHVVSEEVL